MADDVWSGLSKGALAFGHSRAGQLTGSAFSDTGALVTSLFDSSPAGTSKTRLEQLKEDVKNLSAAAEPVINAVKPEVTKAKTAVQSMANELGTDPFTWEAAARAATDLADVLIAFDASVDIIAREVAKPEPTEAARQAMEDQIKGIKEPWIAPFRGLAADAAKGFDAVCHSVLGIDNAKDQFAERLAWDHGQRRFTLKLERVNEGNIGPLAFDGASVEAFFSYKTEANLGITVKSRLKAGLRGDKLLAKMIPGEAPAADTEPTAITLDTLNGLTFGEGKNHKIVLPVRFSFPGVELRELAIALPEGKDQNSGRIDLMMTVAGKLGDVMGCVAEGAGVIIRWQEAGGVEVLPKPPFAAGLRVNTGVLRGGGYLRYKEETGEYGGVLDLQFTKIGVTAIGLIGTEPFSLVIVIGIHFLPKIELGFGFTLSGLGGLVAIERRLDSAEMRKGIHEGTVAMLLFPEHPVDAAPQILDRLGKVFPPQPGGFVVGPIAELGWGSQAGFVKAKIGIVLSLPDPKLVLLGALQIGVPSADVEEKLRIVDLRAEVYGEFTPDYLSILVSLAHSKVAGITISGDLGLLIRWGGGAAFALSVGGFFPKYEPPPELAGLKRVALELSPPVDFLTVHAEAYFAITANTVQFGGGVVVHASLGPVEGKAWLSVDSLFQWSPRLYFIFIIDAGIEVKAFGFTIAGAAFHGELSGTRPWRLEGHASVEILWWDVGVDIGPITWGEPDITTAPPLSPAKVAAQALSAEEAWRPQLPLGAEMLVRFREDETPLLVHPLGSLEVKQMQVPLETVIDRIGSSPVTSRRINLADPKVGALDAAAVSHATDKFPPGHFINMSVDQQASRPDFEELPSGIRVATTATPAFGANVQTTYAWETVYPHEEFASDRGLLNLAGIARLAMTTNAAAAAMRLRENPYLRNGAARAAAENRVAVADPGRVTIARNTDLSQVAGAAEVMPTAVASRMLEELERSSGESLELVAAGVAG
jgi:hypothetical protein